MFIANTNSWFQPFVEDKYSKSGSEMSSSITF